MLKSKIPIFALFIILVMSMVTPISLLENVDKSNLLETQGRDDDFCEDTYTTESACNADSQCEWDAEDDPTDEDYPGECEEIDDEDDDDEDDDDDYELW